MSLPDAKAVDLRIVEITYREKGRGPALIFVHGLGGGAAAWSDQFEAFSDRYRVIAWDSPGSRFCTIEGTGHVIYMEAPERLNACLGEFLADVD